MRASKAVRVSYGTVAVDTVKGSRFVDQVFAPRQWEDAPHDCPYSKHPRLVNSPMVCAGCGQMHYIEPELGVMPDNLEAFLDEHYQEARWVVPDIWPTGLTRIVGSGGSGKSTLAAYCVAKVSEHARVLVVSGEGSIDMLLRVVLACEKYGGNQDNVTFVALDLVANPRILGASTVIDQSMPTRWSDKPFNYAVLDSQISLAHGEENSAEAIRAVMDSARLVAKNVLLIHHTGHINMASPGAGSRGRGSSDGRNAVDAELLLEPKDVRGDSFAHLKVDKLRSMKGSKGNLLHIGGITTFKYENWEGPVWFTDIPEEIIETWSAQDEASDVAGERIVKRLLKKKAIGKWMDVAGFKKVLMKDDEMAARHHLCNKEGRPLTQIWRRLSDKLEDTGYRLDKRPSDPKQHRVVKVGSDAKS